MDGKPDFLTIIDESHVTIPQIGGMYAGDRSRKKTLIEHGFRLPSALDNRPLTFKEFEERVGQIVFTTATPGEYELTHSPKPVEQKETPTQEKPKSQNTSEIFAVIDKKIAEEKAQLIPEARRHKTKEELFDWMYKREQLGSVAISLSEASQHLFEADPENAFMIESIEASRKDVDGYAKKVRETKKYEDFRDNTTYSKEPRKQELGLLAKNVKNVYGNQNYDFSNTLRDTGRSQERQERLEYNIRQAEEALRKKRASFNYRTEQEYKAYKRRRSALSP
jgi:hypothetical protein